MRIKGGGWRRRGRGETRSARWKKLKDGLEQRPEVETEKVEMENLQLSDDNLHRLLRLLSLPSLISVSQQSDSFPRQPNVLGLIKTEESGQESGNVDKIQNHQKNHHAGSPLLTLRNAALLTAEGRGWLEGGGQRL